MSFYKTKSHDLRKATRLYSSHILSNTTIQVKMIGPKSTKTKDKIPGIKEWLREDEVIVKKTTLDK
jgi:hypothetical protein